LKISSLILYQCVSKIVEIVHAGSGVESSKQAAGKGKKRKLEEHESDENDENQDIMTINDAEDDDDVAFDDGGGSDENDEDHVKVVSLKKKVKLDNKVKEVKESKKKVVKKLKVAATSEWAVVDVSQENSNELQRIEKEVARKAKASKSKNKKKQKVEPAPSTIVEDNLTTEESEFCADEWMKIGVRDPVLTALKEVKFDKPTAIQVR